MALTSKRKSPAFSTKKISVLQANPKVAAEAHGWDPSKIAKASSKKLSWKCKRKGHVWDAVVNNRVKGIGCPYCSGARVSIGENDLKTTHPKIARQADGWDPRTVSAGSGIIQNWKCSKGHTWRVSTDSRTSKDSGCAYCSNKKTWPGYNDLKTLYPIIAKEASGWDPSKVGPGTHEIKKWKCPKGHTYKTQVYNRTAGRNCSVCKGNQINIGVNDLKTTHPRIANEADGWNPRNFVAGNNRKFDWKCKFGHEWVTSISSRTSQNSSCPYCSGLRKIAGKNDLQTLFPAISKQAHGWNPKGVAAGSSTKRKWICTLGHIYWASPTKRTARGYKCPYCSGARFLRGFNDLKTRFPSLAKEAYGWNPEDVGWGIARKYPWKCKKGHIFEASPNARTCKKNGCPNCANTGFKPNRAGWIYFLRHEKWKMLQIGITNVPEQRIAKHKRLGWKVIEIEGPMKGAEARSIEKMILDFLYANGAVLGPASTIKTFDGYTEAWIESSFPTKTLKALTSKAKRYYGVE